MAEKGTVCVTGAGGYVASWLVKLLLSNNYTVHGTVRDPGDDKYIHLKKLEKASEKLKLFKADLLDYNSLSPVITGCQGVELIEPAVNGTLNVLKACFEANVKRVVYVSSGTAVTMNPNWPKGRVKDETCWSDKEYCKTTQNWYSLSKTDAESEAWEFAKRSGLDIVTVCPTLVFGPMLQCTTNASSLVLIKLLKEGCEKMQDTFRRLVDVRDVAEALLLVYERTDTEGRYICMAHMINTEDLVKMLRSIFPNCSYPKSLSPSNALSYHDIAVWRWKNARRRLDPLFLVPICPDPVNAVELIEPAVNGTLNVLKACVEANVTRVVYVSSAAAISMNPNWPKGQVKDETCWSDKEYCRTTNNWYCLSKTVAESEAWEFAKRSGLDIVTVCPTHVLGPMLQGTTNASSLVLIKLLKEGYEKMQNMYRMIVDVRDVAEALLLVYERPDTKGRYICMAHMINTEDLVNMLRSIFPNYRYPKRHVHIQTFYALTDSMLLGLTAVCVFWKGLAPWLEVAVLAPPVAHCWPEVALFLLTWAGGYVASWLVKLLLSNNYTVHGTVRDPEADKYIHLKKLEKASENLKLFKADLLDYTSLSAAITGCQGVELVEPAVNGTLNVLKACVEANVMRVVYVSSGAAVSMNPNWPKGQVKDETCWSDKEYCRTTNNWYCLSKTVAESEAWEFAKRSGLDIVTVCPTLVLGPMLQCTTNASSLVLIKLLKGTHLCHMHQFVSLEGYEKMQNTYRMIVDVRDVAEALLLVYERPDTKGRYICTAHMINTEDLVNMLRSIFPNYRYPKRSCCFEKTGSVARERQRDRETDRTMGESGEKQRVCVTGAGGYVASWVVKLLLSKGYMVHGTVRDPSDEKKNGHLKKLENAAENLQLFKTDMLDYEGLCAAVAGCTGVLHVELLEPAVTGTKNLLNACLKAKVKKVVVVSSVAAVCRNPNWPADQAMDESCWTDIEYCKGIENWYCVSKTIAEGEALGYTKRSELNIVTVCPSIVLGPMLQSTLNASSLFLLNYMKDKGDTVEDKDYGVVDVRDTAEAILLAYENPEAEGRYICSSYVVRTRDLVEKLKRMFPNYNYPQSFTEAKDNLKLTSEKLQKLGWRYRPLEETIVDAVKSYEESGLLSH
ncbi:hypothetical protein RJ640_020663 [Escallonia rubra]|uniref:Dihydroflavonol 4-reductase n=1 Tax=Escallonia rubra TaxID=112253 RepID=A0AA88RY27_9ASTE|nr:hypothetical protein RJ640_020663 [Escallonia rubra]